MFGYNVAILLASTIIIPCVIGGIYFRKLPVDYKVIVLLVVFGFFTELTLIILPYFEINNLFGMHIIALAEIILLSLYFLDRLKTSNEKKTIRIITIGLSAFALAYSALGDNITEFNSIPRALECIYFSALSCYVFYEMSIDPAPEEEKSFYYINGAILFYFSSSFMVFSFSKFMMDDNQNLLVMYNVHSIVNAMCNIAYATGLWIASRSSYSAA